MKTSVICITILISTISMKCDATWPYYKQESSNLQMRRQVYGNNNNYYDLAPQNFHFQQMNHNAHVDNNLQPCNCVKLKFCNPIMEMARNMYTGIISDYINSQLHVYQCKVNSKGEMYVCCPNYYNNNQLARNWNGADDEDSEEEYDNRYSHHQRRPQYVSYPIQGFYRPPPKHHQRHNKPPVFAVNHEDPRTNKNCPPAFSPEFELLPNHTFFNENDKKASMRVEPVTTTTTISPSIAALPSELQSKMRLINQDDCGRSSSSRIIGGEDADIGRFLWMARLAYRNRTSGKISYRCAGTLIANKYVLSAGHCAQNLVDEIELALVRLGEVDTEQENECNENGFCTKEEDFMIERIIVHPNYNKPRYQFDIALIKLFQSTAASDSFSPICLPIGAYERFANDLSDGTNGIVAGFGASSRTSNAQNPRLQTIRLPFVETPKCASFYANYSATLGTRILISNNQLCVQGRDAGDVCAGDSGGPLMSDSTHDKYVLLGIVSFGPRTCGLSNFPGVYTKVSSFMQWILQNMDE